jgi:pyruvate dehydrogenase E1 component
MPAMPEDESVQDGILQGGYRFKVSESIGEKIHLLASGSIMQQALAAAEKLEAMGYSVDDWSITSFTELYREAAECERYNRLHPTGDHRVPYIEALFKDEGGIAVAVTDYMKSLPHSIAKWMPQGFTVLGTDGYGISESREDIRNFFEISPDYIAQAAIASLYHQGKIDKPLLDEQLKQLNFDAEKIDPVSR